MKPKTWIEWRKLHHQTTYSLGFASTTYWDCKASNAPRFLIQMAARSCYVYAARIKRIQARMDANQDETWARAMWEMCMADGGAS